MGEKKNEKKAQLQNLINKFRGREKEGKISERHGVFLGRETDWDWLRNLILLDIRQGPYISLNGGTWKKTRAATLLSLLYDNGESAILKLYPYALRVRMK